MTADIGSTGDVVLPCGGGMRVGALGFDNGVSADIGFTWDVRRLSGEGTGVSVLHAALGVTLDAGSVVKIGRF